HAGSGDCAVLRHHHHYFQLAGRYPVRLARSAHYLPMNESHDKTRKASASSPGRRGRFCTRKHRAMAAVAGRSLTRDALLRLMANKAAMLSLTLLILIVLMVIVGPWLSPNNYYSQDYDQIWVAPTWVHGHIFGTDSVGRDLFVRTMIGGRISLLVGIVATLVSLIIGVTYGATAGYIGGRVDNVMMRLVDI